MMWFSPLVNKVIDNSFMSKTISALGMSQTVPGAPAPDAGMKTAYSAFFNFAMFVLFVAGLAVLIKAGA